MFSPFTVYTILAPDRLARIAASRRATSVHESKRWVTARRLLHAANRAGEIVPIVFADAARDCSTLIYWGHLRAITVTARGTTYTVANVARLKGHRTHQLVLRSTRRTIAPGYIRPYAIVETPRFLPLPAPERPITLFSFGYWGSGSATRELVEAIDAGERSRGFEPPLWVDVRIQRSVRAAGFRDDAFAQLLGDRYVWMPALGNVRIQEGGGGIKVKDPAAANELLDHAIRDTGRRVIFFCACEVPMGCHRRKVSKLLAAAARARGIEATIVEWPGGEPARHTVDMLPASMEAFVRGSTSSLAIPPSMSVADAALLPWGSVLTLRSRDETYGVVVGPARFNAAGAHLPLVEWSRGGDGKRLETASRRHRTGSGYLPIR